MKNASVAVFATGIDANKTETKGTVRMTTADQLSNFSAGEESFLEKIIQEIASSVIIINCVIFNHLNQLSTTRFHSSISFVESSKSIFECFNHS